MKIAALGSGGKDGSYALWKALEKGHEVVKIVTMFPEQEDSWMFHKPNLDILDLYSKTAKIPLVKKHTQGMKEKELKDLKEALRELPIDGVVTGALASNYQRKRIQKICNDLSLESITPLWNMDPFKLLENLLKENFKIIITSVSAKGLDEDWLGREINRSAIKDIKELEKKFGIHPTGEGGEYETLTLYAPFFEKRIEPTKTKKKWTGDRGHLDIIEAKLSSI